MPDKIHQVSPLHSPSIGVLLLVFGWIFQKQAVAFLVPERNQHYASRSSSSGSSYGGQCRLGSSLSEDRNDYCDTLETLSDLLSNLLSANETDAHPTQDRQRQRQRELLTTRLSNAHGYDIDSEDIHINVTYVETSTIANAGLGLFVHKDCPEGTLLTCYPGDALVDLASDGDGVMDDIDTTTTTDTDTAEGRVTWGSHASSTAFPLRQDYMLRAIRDHWGIVAVPEIYGEDDPSYLGHFANDGARHPPMCESELAAYVIESADTANAMHQPCEECHMVTVATRDLKAGEEIFVTYGPDYWREQASFVVSSSSSSSSQDSASSSSSQDSTSTVDEDQIYDDGFDDEDFDDSDLEDDFEFDYYDSEADAIVTDIISSIEQDSTESPSRGKGFG